MAVSSKFGWLVSGPTKGIGRSLTCVSTSLMVEGSDIIETTPVIDSDITRELR